MRALGRFVLQYFKMNLLATTEYRVSFFSQLIGMFANDAMWLFFWKLFFERFPVLNGWQIEDVVLMWAVITFSYGLATGFFGNCVYIAELVVKGQLDYYLTIPKSAFFHVLVSRMRPTALGDLLFGIIVFALFCNPTWDRAALFLVVSVCSAIVQLSFYSMAGASAFFVGSGEVISIQASSVLIHFSSYPSPIFGSRIKWLLYTLIPAGFVSGLPVEVVRDIHLPDILLLTSGALVFLMLAIGLFYYGLRRYESGNLVQMRE